MPEVFLTRNQRREKAVARLINAARIDQVAQKSEMSKVMGMHPVTLSRKIKDPGTFTLAEMWALMDFLHTPEEQRGEILK